MIIAGSNKLINFRNRLTEFQLVDDSVQFSFFHLNAVGVFRFFCWLYWEFFTLHSVARAASAVVAFR